MARVGVRVRVGVRCRVSVRVGVRKWVRVRIKVRVRVRVRVGGMVGVKDKGQTVIGKDGVEDKEQMVKLRMRIVLRVMVRISGIRMMVRVRVSWHKLARAGGTQENHWREVRGRKITRF